MRQLYESSIRLGDVCGKWMLFVHPHRADETWIKVAKAVEEGKLGDSAIISPCLGSRKRVVVCVYAADFSDRADCERVLRGLYELGCVVTCGFKADALTDANLYTSTLAALGLRYSWQLHLDILDKVCPSTRKQASKGFDWSSLASSN